jgi:8-oxo-dGTP pyrophosphatase MutT (NUDIX family)
MSPHGTHSPSYLKLLEAHSVSLPSLDVPKTPTEESPEEKEKRRASMQAFRQKLDETAKKSDNNFEFGESFRQKQRFSLLTDKQKRKEAEVTIKGFDAMVLSGGKTATGEVDTSNLEKTFVFETSPTDKFRPSDGICRVDYQNTQYEGYVFLVHRTRGLILLQYRVGDGDVTKAHVPGGSIQENEFLRAAEKSGNEKIQLQIAARAAAARQLFEKTGINVTNSLDRMKPAVLRLHAPDTKDGTMMLKNEQGNRLYYFLQVSDEDFIQGGPEDKLSGPSGESDSSLKVRKCQQLFHRSLHCTATALIVSNDFLLCLKF